jgi:hypothetical protein
MDMRNTMYDFQEENRTLKDTLREQEVWIARASRCELVVAPGGATVYRSKESPQHYACPVCARGGTPSLSIGRHHRTHIATFRKYPRSKVAMPFMKAFVLNVRNVIFAQLQHWICLCLR